MSELSFYVAEVPHSPDECPYYNYSERFVEYLCTLGNGHRECKLNQLGECPYFKRFPMYKFYQTGL